MIAPPVLDPRDETALLAELRAKSPSYLLSGWRPQPQGPGDGLLTILARFASLVIQDLNAAPDKDFLAFLDAMGITLLAPQAARAPLIFSLASGAPTDVTLPADTEVAANLPPPLPSSLGNQQASAPASTAPLIFATDEAISLTRARLAAVHSRIPALDSYADHTRALTSSFTLFDQAALQPIAHHLYLGHDTLFDLPASPAATVTIEVTPANVTPAGAPVQGVPSRWEYLSKEGWLAFEPVVDATGGFTTQASVALTKSCGPALEKASVNGVQSFWLRAVASQPLPLPGGSGKGPALPLLSQLRALVSYTSDPLPLDTASNNGFRLDTSKHFYPFGTQPLLSSTFLFACDEAFKRTGSTIQVNVALSHNGAAHDSLVVKWEYSVGAGIWNEVPGLSADLTSPPSISFPRPPDWQKVTVEGDAHFWLRARIAQGSYGGPVKYKVDQANGEVVSHDPPDPPIIASLTASYTISTGGVVPDHCFAYNSFTYEDVTEACRWGRRPFQPFQATDDRTPAVYFGFDRPLPIGLISIYADVPNPGEADSLSGTSAYTWEYRGPRGWSELAVHDETSGFQQSGLIQFIGPPELQSDDGPGGTRLFWIRARRLAPSAEPTTQSLASLYVNGVWASQRTSVRGEIAGRSDGAPRQVFRLQHPHILGNEQVEVEEWHGTTREWQSLFQEVASDRIRYDRNALGNVTGVWITWTEKTHLYSSGPHDRDYALERNAGLLRFGDGVMGMIPPPGAPVAVSYDFGGGAPGNVAANTISQLHSPVPQVQSVTNPVAAGGGAESEAVTAVHLRGPQRLRNRDRAVAAADYEWLAREASAELAVVRCLEATGPRGPGQPGWITIVIAPWSDAPQPMPSVELMRRVRDHVAQRAPAAIAGQIRVVAPSYVPISVHAQVALGDPTRAAEVEEELRRRLDDFLHPLKGGAHATGWEFGQPVHLSQVAQTVRETPGVDYAIQVQLTSGGVVFGDAVTVDPMRLPAAGQHVLKLELEA